MTPLCFVCGWPATNTWNDAPVCAQDYDDLDEIGQPIG